ncbi:hypothetical protein DUNSADRAFT_5093 [Dunaliella salina]|uniref:HTH cro/C1-type domain-containing protein n=1 Tax=Dunaliella salina TaxID=3046 RepID=A0ABQ7HAH4_DUNSA|nr:hypothetical protein DUNSADRAFT_5093 [Dunaliella salina]|eukprot:KAF5843855.1 hypothetical protein DUNSADRAFT_5093 [Dunaliella salina]
MDGPTNPHAHSLPQTSTQRGLANGALVQAWKLCPRPDCQPLRGLGANKTQAKQQGSEHTTRRRSASAAPSWAQSHSPNNIPKKAQNDAKLTQAQLAQRINEKPQVIQEHENGKAIFPSQMSSKLSRVLNVQLEK